MSEDREVQAIAIELVEMGLAGQDGDERPLQDFNAKHGHRSAALVDKVGDELLELIKATTIEWGESGEDSDLIRVAGMVLGDVLRMWSEESGESWDALWRRVKESL